MLGYDETKVAREEFYGAKKPKNLGMLMLII